MRTEQIPAFTQAVKDAGGRALPLAVGGGFHSPFMAQAALQLRDYAQKLPFQEPVQPLYANATGGLYTAAEAAALLGTQVESPVRWTSLIRTMLADGYTGFVELGAGRTLSGLIGKIGGTRRIANVEDAASLTATVQLCKEDAGC